MKELIFWVEHYYSDKEVGLYSGPIRLYQSLLPFIAILSSVFFSEILIENDNKKVAKRVNQGLWLVNAICLPVIVGTYFVGSELMGLILGEVFKDAGSILLLWF